MIYSFVTGGDDESFWLSVSGKERTGRYASWEETQEKYKKLMKRKINQK